VCGSLWNAVSQVSPAEQVVAGMADKARTETTKLLITFSSIYHQEINKDLLVHKWMMKEKKYKQPATLGASI
jgi:hypothetical protein